MSLAIFDLDNTLLGGDSDHSWGEFLVEQKLVDPDIFRSKNDQFYKQYKDGTLDIIEFLAFALEPLSRFSMAELDRLHAQFMREKIAPILLPKAQRLLDKHRDQGDDLLIITATNRFVTAPIAKALGINDLLATDPEVVDGRYTGQVAGTPCFQDGKVIRLREWLKHYPGDMQGSYFYSDSINDLPLLELVKNPVAVDPDERLFDHAQKAGWQIISLRD